MLVLLLLELFPPELEPRAFRRELSWDRSFVLHSTQYHLLVSPSCDILVEGGNAGDSLVVRFGTVIDVSKGQVPESDEERGP